MAAAVQIEPIEARSGHWRFAPELELLLASARPARDRELDLRTILGSPLDWDRVLRVADRHRLLPALWSVVQARGDISDRIRAAIGERFEIHQRRVLRFTAELARILWQFDHHKIQVLAHKGAALAQLLYGDAAMRQFGDLDFLVRAEDVPRAAASLTELGYAPKIQLSPRQEREYLRSGYEHVFGLNSDRNLVEVQWQIVPRFYAINFDLNGLFARSIQVNVGGLPLRTLGQEDLLLVLCVHAAKHEWAQIGMLRDIATLTRFDLDWRFIDREARRLGIARILAVSLALAGSLFSVDLTALPVLRDESARVEEIAASFQSEIIAGAEAETESLRYFLSMMRLRECRRDRVRMAWRLAATPSVGEWQAARIPDSLFTLYRGVRLLRLMKRFCFSAQAFPATPVE